jgi:hypothetical protein
MLNKHLLKYELALDFLKESLEGTNILSIELMKFINSNRGQFYTLLPNDADLSHLHDFNSSILKQNPIVKHENGANWKYQTIPTIRDELSTVLMGILGKNKRLACVFDDFNSTYKEGYNDNFYRSYGIRYHSEVYYWLDSSVISKEILLKCLQLSNTLWHSVCLLTEASKEDIVDQQGSLFKIHEICLGMRLALFGAYDGEGYVFWEKTLN